MDDELPSFVHGHPGGNWLVKTVSEGLGEGFGDYFPVHTSLLI